MGKLHTCTWFYAGISIELIDNWTISMTSISHRFLFFCSLFFRKNGKKHSEIHRNVHSRMACFIFRLLHSIRIVQNKSTKKKEWLHHSINIQLDVQVFSKEIIFIDAIVVIAYSIVFSPIFNSHVPFFPFHKPKKYFLSKIILFNKMKKEERNRDAFLRKSVIMSVEFIWIWPLDVLIQDW